MSAKVSSPVRILAVVGMLGALALGGGFVLLGRTSGSSAPPKAIEPLHGHVKVTAATAAKKHATAAKAKAAAKAHTHKLKPAAKPKTAPARATIVHLPDTGLPPAVSQALLAHEVVVVSLYDPEALVDSASIGEAQAGARLANVGFVPLNVLSEAQAVPLAKKLGVLPDPALLVFRRPGELVFRVNGFADRATVAQAASNAKP